MPAESSDEGVCTSVDGVIIGRGWSVDGVGAEVVDLFCVVEVCDELLPFSCWPPLRERASASSAVDSMLLMNLDEFG